MMRKALFFLFLILGAAPVMAQKVKVGSDRSVDLAKYKTYAFDKGVTGHNPIINQMIVDAIDSALTSKGLKKVETNPDMTVVIVAATDSTLYLVYPNWSNAMGSAAATGISVGTQSWPITEGMLAVDIADGQTKNSVWRGTATHTLGHGPTGDMAKDAKSVEKTIKKSVEKMFKQFPVASGK